VGTLGILEKVQCPKQKSKHLELKRLGC